MVALRRQWIIFPAARAGEPSPAQFLAEKGLVRSGAAYILTEENDLRDRVAEIGMRYASWKQEQAGVDERIETISRLRLQHQEIMKKLRSLVNGTRPATKGAGPPPFPDDGPRGPGAMRPPPDSRPFQRGTGPPPPPPDGIDGFGPGAMDDLMRQLQVGDSRRQYSALNAERAARAAEIVHKQVFCDDIARRLKRQLGELEQRRLEAVALDKRIRARYDNLARDPQVKQASGSLNESSDSQISLGPLTDYSRDLTELARGLLTESREGMLKPSLRLS